MLPSGTHNDWPWPLSLIPRRFNSWESTLRPKLLLGNIPAGHHLDVPPPGTWGIVWPLGLVLKTKGAVLFAVQIARYDYLADYWTAPRLAWKKQKA